jgi:hypothetical protein
VCSLRTLTSCVYHLLRSLLNYRPSPIPSPSPSPSPQPLSPSPSPGRGPSPAATNCSNLHQHDERRLRDTQRLRLRCTRAPFLATLTPLLITPSTTVTLRWTSSQPTTWSPQNMTGGTSSRGFTQFTSNVMPKHTATVTSRCTATVLSGPPAGYALDLAASVMTVTGLANGL